MPLQKLEFRPGLNREGTDYANEGGWYDGDKIRFRSGFPEKIGGWVKVMVEDTGPGVEDRDLQKIFEKFEQASSPDMQKFEGTGLGLAICKQIVEQLGGHIWAESEAGKGSKFAFLLPVNRKKE